MTEKSVSHFMRIRFFLQFKKTGNLLQRKYRLQQSRYNNVAKVFPVITFFNRSRYHTGFDIITDHGTGGGFRTDQLQGLVDDSQNLFQIQTDIRNGWLPILVLLISFFLAELLYRIEMIRCSKKAA